MAQEEKEPVIKVPALLGPTAVGKTDVALAVAEELGLDIISCDSRQIYQYMDIGTAKPSPAQRRRVRHWLVDIVEPSQPYSAYQFAVSAAEIVRRLHSEGRQALICGGTGFYFKALTHGLGPQLPSEPELRQKYEKTLARSGPGSIFEELKAVDPETAGRIHPNDIQRIIRALNVYHSTGIPISELKRHARPPHDLEFCVTIAHLPRTMLYGRINARVDRMIDTGLWEEYRALRQRGYHRGSPGMLCVGYRELFDVEAGHLSMKEACEKIKTTTRRYAKRQITWFRHQTKGTVVDFSTDPGGIIKERVARFLGDVRST